MGGNAAPLSEESSASFHDTAKSVQYTDDFACNFGDLGYRIKT